MAKYSDEFKLKVVNYYLKEKTSYPQTARHFNMSDWSSIHKWVNLYQENGINGIVKPPKIHYSGDFKKNVVEYMHTNHLSLKSTSYHFNIKSSSIIGKWERIYYEKGPQALYEERRGGPRNMSYKPKKKKSNENGEDALLKEIEQLRMENEYLKKLNALVQERIKRENKKK